MDSDTPSYLESCILRYNTSSRQQEYDYFEPKFLKKESQDFFFYNDSKISRLMEKYDFPGLRDIKVEQV